MKRALRLFPFLPMDYLAVQRWLDRRAARGWALTAVRFGVVAVFRRTDRADLRHCVELTSGPDDPSYLRLCADAGWLRVARVGALNLFRSLPGRAPLPLQTDSGLEAERFGRICLRGGRFFPVLLLLMAAYLVFEALLFSEDGLQLYQLLFSGVWHLFLSQVILFAALAWLFLNLARLWRRIRRSAAAGEGLPAPTVAGAWARGLLLWVLLGLFLLVCLCAAWRGTGTDTARLGREGPLFHLEETALGLHAHADCSPDYSGWILLDRFDCAAPWLAALTERSLRREESQSPPPMGHLHAGGLELEETELPFGRAWVGEAEPAFPGGEPIHCLIVRRGNQVLRLCGDEDFTTPEALGQIQPILSCHFYT